jgi:hypothetical protein
VVGSWWRMLNARPMSSLKKWPIAFISVPTEYPLLHQKSRNKIPNVFFLVVYCK